MLQPLQICNLPLQHCKYVWLGLVSAGVKKRGGKKRLNSCLQHESTDAVVKAMYSCARNELEYPLHSYQVVVLHFYLKDMDSILV